MHGMPAHAIAEAAADFDLLVVGSRGYGPLRRTLLGSVSAKLMRSTPCAALVLPRGAGADPLSVADRLHGDERDPRR
jgi:nucleotide-binding universal stress UspA family protein